MAADQVNRMAKKNKAKNKKQNSIPAPNEASENNLPTAQTAPIAGFWPRIGAIVYDLLLVVGIAALASAVGTGIAVLLIKFDLVTMAEHYQDIGEYTGDQAWFAALVWGSVIAFYLWFWTHGGQTMGMRAWRLRVQNSDGSMISLTQAMIRLATAALGLGNLLVPFDHKNRAFQDHWGRCDVLRLSKEQNRALLKRNKQPKQ